jgi:hypothetical protein
MADHKVVVATTWNSNLVHLLDITDGGYSAVEFNEYAYIDALVRDKNGAMVVDMDGRGTATISNFLNGAGVKVVDNKPGIDKGIIEPPKLLEDREKRPYAPGVNMSVWGASRWDEHGRYETLDGTVLLDPNVTGVHYTNISLVPPGEVDPILVSWNGGYGYDYSNGFSVTNCAFKDGFVYLGIALPNLLAYPQRRVIVKVPPKDGFNDEVTALEVIDLGVANTYEESLLLPSIEYFNFLNDGTLVLDAYGQEGYYRLDGTTLTFVATPGVIGPVSIMNLCRRAGKAIAYDMDWVGHDVKRDSGFTVRKVTNNLVAGNVVVPPLDGTYLPASTGEIWGDDEFDGDSLILYTYALTPVGETEPQVVHSFAVVDLTTGNVTAQNFADKVTVNAPCPLAAMDVRDMLVTTLPAYQITGTIELDGSAVETQLFVMENESMRIVGRTKADPVTGEYSFRCWTTGKKSILAQHPVSKGLRIAAELTPVLVP